MPGALRNAYGVRAGDEHDKARGGGDGALYPARERHGGGVCFAERTGAGSGDPGGEHGEQPGEDDRPEAGVDCGDGGVCREADGAAGQQGRRVRRGGAGRDFVAGEAHRNPDLRCGHGAEDDKGGGEVDFEPDIDGGVGAGVRAGGDGQGRLRGWGRRGGTLRKRT